jgi:hypothetical protein
MNIILQFSNPYQRFQVQNAFNNVLDLPDGAVVTVRNEARDTELMVDIDAKLDTIDAIKVSGFDNKVDVAAFISSIPNAAFPRISRITLA